MTFKSGTIAVVGVLLVAGAVVWWFWQRPASPSSLPNTGPVGFPADTDAGPSGSNSGGTTNASSLPSQITSPDLDAQYATLYVRLGINELVFSPLVSNGPFAALYSLYNADRTAYLALFPAGKPQLLVATADLNGDGTDEALVYEDFPGYCGSAGCGLEVYKKEKSGWKSILSAEASNRVGISYTTQNGYAILYLSVQGADLGYQTQIVQYVAVGGNYQPSGTVATWNGAMFKSPRK